MKETSLIVNKRQKCPQTIADMHYLRRESNKNDNNERMSRTSSQEHVFYQDAVHLKFSKALQVVHKYLKS